MRGFRFARQHLLLGLALFRHWPRPHILLPQRRIVR